MKIAIVFGLLVAIGGEAAAQPCSSPSQCDDFNPCTQNLCTNSACDFTQAMPVDGASNVNVTTASTGALTAIAVDGVRVVVAQASTPPAILDYTSTPSGLTFATVLLANQAATGLAFNANEDLAILDGNALRLIDGGGSNVVAPVSFVGSPGVAITADDLGNVYVLRANGAVEVFDDALVNFDTIDPMTTGAISIAWMDGQLYVLDGTGKKVVRGPDDGGPLVAIVKSQITALTSPNAIAAGNNAIYVLGAPTIVKIDEVGNVLSSFTGPPNGVDITLDHAGSLFSASASAPNGRIYRFPLTASCDDGNACNGLAYCNGLTCGSTTPACGTGACSEPGGATTCGCPATNVGPNCGLVCPTGPNGVCNDDGTCVEVAGAASCACDAGAFGTNCGSLCPGVTVAGVDTNECGNAPGAHRGVCADGSGGAGTCTCDTGWYLPSGASSGNGLCTLTKCGDGTTVGTEVCDDGDNDTLDNCPSGPGTNPGLCQQASCGDGFVDGENPVIEQCDDGNDIETDACVKGQPGNPRCQNAKCGDGFRRTDISIGQPGYEECDDGNTNNNDNCTTTCKVSVCGDGFKLDGVEACDDGDHDNNDACPDDPSTGGTCQFAACGDGFVNLEVGGTPALESCDNGPLPTNGDGCSAVCQLEAGFTCTGTKNTTCTGTCRAFYDFATSDYFWKVSGEDTASTHWSYGATFATYTGWRVPQAGNLLPGAINANIWKAFTVPTADVAKSPTLKITYDASLGTNDCLRVYVTATPVVGAATPATSACGNATASTINVPMSAFAGQTRFVTLRLDAVETGGGRNGLAIRRVSLESDADNDTVLDFRTLSCGDTCVDGDNDTYGDPSTRTPATCAGGAAADCRDDLFAVKPGAVENCGDSLDNDCDALTDVFDTASCQEDCADGIDNGTNGLVDCADPVCTGQAFGAAVPDAFCSVPCRREFSFETGPGPLFREDMTPGGTVQNIWNYSTGTWVTSGLAKGPGSGRQFGRLQYVARLGKSFAGPQPKLSITYDHDGASAGRDVLAVCISTSGPPTCQGADPNIILLRDTPTDDAVASGIVTSTVDLTPFVNIEQVYVAILFDTFEGNQYPTDANGVIIHSVRLASDADQDGLYEGRSTGDGSTCDGCWDVDGDRYGDELSTNLSSCLAHGGTPPLFDCDDGNALVNPDVADEKGVLCGDGLNNDCDFNPSTGAPLIDAFDSGCGTEDCANGVDDNDDSLVDCDGPICAASSLSCGECTFGYDFNTGHARDTASTSSTGASNGWQPSVPAGQGRLWDYTDTSESIGNPTKAVIGWETRHGESYGAAGTGRVRGWLTRRVQVPPQMPEPELVVTYYLEGDNTKDAFGVCFNADPATCGYQTGSTTAFNANVKWSTKTNTPEVTTARVRIPAGQVDVVFFFDTGDNTDNAHPGVYIDQVQIISDVDRDGQGEYFGRFCDDCVDWDKDGYGDDSYPVTDLLSCPHEEPDCDDRDARRSPGLTEQCYAPADAADDPLDPDDGINRDNNCDEIVDNQTPACKSCGNTHIETGETCDDGNIVDTDGCDQNCQIKAGGLYVSEIHLPIVNNNAAEQWIELYNGLPTPVDVTTLGLGLRYDKGTPTTSDDITVMLDNTSQCQVQTSYQIDPNLPGRRPYYVIAFGPIASSDFADTSNIDMICPGFSLLESGAGTLRVFRNHAATDVVDDVKPSTLVCGDGVLEYQLSPTTVRGRSIQLRSAASNSDENDTAAVWCLAGNHDLYSVTGRHLGSPGLAGVCGELACDGKDDDCDGTKDETVPYRDGSQERELADADVDGVCDLKDCDPLVSECNMEISDPTCTVDLDGDQIADCKDPCLDADRDGYSPTGDADDQEAPFCFFEPASCDDSDAEFIRERENLPIITNACTNGLDDDCDLLGDCLDSDCSGQNTCLGETCDTATTVTCGSSIVATPLSVDFSTCFPEERNLPETGRDKAYKFTATDTGRVRFKLTNIGTRLFTMRVTVDACTDLGDGADKCAAPAAIQSGSQQNPAQTESTCISGAFLDIDTVAGKTYFITLKTIDNCANGPSPSAQLVVACSETGHCTDNQDQDADGLKDCADSDCVADAACGGLDFDGDGVNNGLELLCQTDPLVPSENLQQDAFRNPDNDLLINCVDPNDDNDPVNDSGEVDVDGSGSDTAECGLNASTAKNDPNIYPNAPKNCNQVLIDADCNGQYDTTEAFCGVREDICADGQDNDSDGRADCDDPDCVPNPLCRCADFDQDGFTNEVEIACDTDPLNCFPNVTCFSVPNPPDIADDIEVPGSAVATCDDNGVGDGIPNCADTDDDGDGFPDTEEIACGSNPIQKASIPLDTDGDRQCDAFDPDDDNDTFADTHEIACNSDSKKADSTPLDASHNADTDNICNALDSDDDNDGWPDIDEGDCETDPLDQDSNPTNNGEDLDEDRFCDRVDLDDDEDGWLDADEADCGTNGHNQSDFPPDCDEDGICDVRDGDDDGDGVPDAVEETCGTGICDALDHPLAEDAGDPDNDHVPSCVDPDDDDDGVLDTNEALIGTNRLDKDTDDDGLEDGVENKNKNGVIDVTETNPLKADTDADNLRDNVEVESCYKAGLDNEACQASDPLKADTDGDLRVDGLEDVNHNGQTDAGETSPVMRDTDGDGVDDGEEIRCASNPVDPEILPTDHDDSGECDGAEKDTDGDHIADGVETFCGTDPLDNRSVVAIDDLDDTDTDGDINCVDTDDDDDDVLDTEEIECGNDARDPSDEPSADDIGNYDRDEQLNCSDVDDDNDGLNDVDETVTNPRDADSDDDGLLDGREVNIDHTNPMDADSDDDGLSDGLELGVATAHADTAGDFQPDLDPATKTDPNSPDTDSDQVSDGEEDKNHNGRVDEGEGDPLDETDGLFDSDGDGLPDRDEDGKWHTDPKNPDSDLDGLDDKLEVTVYFTDPNVADTDGGGVSDKIEIDNKTDPNVGEDDFATAEISGQNVFSCAGGAGAATFFGLAIGVLLWLRRRARA